MQARVAVGGRCLGYSRYACMNLSRLSSSGIFLILCNRVLITIIDLERDFVNHGPRAELQRFPFLFALLGPKLECCFSEW